MNLNKVFYSILSSAYFLISVTGLIVWAADSSSSSSQVVDLGELSVTGEVRRPAITWIDSQKSVREVVPSLLKNEYELYESELLEANSLKLPMTNHPQKKSLPSAKPQNSTPTNQKKVGRHE